jgi:beta-galactosidase
VAPSETPGTFRPQLWLGVVYHPEHWPEERWSEDVHLMTEAGLTVARLADCAWATLEPAAGQFNFGWLDRAIALLAEAGISTVLGSSNFAPPGWLVRQCPDLLAKDPTGRCAQLGASYHGCINSPVFQAAVARLVSAMAQHFGPNPDVIGWQIDSESKQDCYCPRCQAGFRRYLAERHVSIEVFNRRWVRGCRGEAYSDWEQVTIPFGQYNPVLTLDFARFVTHTCRQFQRLQIELLRPHLRPDVWIAGSPAGWNGDHDPYTLAEDTDYASSAFCTVSERHDHRSTGALRALARGVKRRNFWILDTEASMSGGAVAKCALHKDELQALVWQAVAHGADGVLCWQWRPAPAGVDQHHITLVDQSGQPRPFFEEVKLLGLEFNALSNWVAGSTTAKARVAILNSCDSRWVFEGQRHQTGFSYVEHLEHWYRPLAARNVAVDIIPPDGNLDQYKMVIAPALSVLDDKIVGSLTELVRHSGHLVLTIRTGTRDEHNALFPLRQPGPLRTIAGVEVEDYYSLDEPVPVKGNWFEGVSRQWAERLRILDPNKAVKIARYGTSNGWLDNEIAITVCAQGTGLTYMVGAYLDVAAQQAMVDHFLQNAGLQKIDAPPGVEVCIRVMPDGKQLYVVINHERSPATVTLPSPAQNPLTDQAVTGPFRLAPYGVAVLLRAQPPQTSTV